jgi:hypothetical protein
MIIKLVPYKDFWIRIGLSLVVVFFFEFLGTESFNDAITSRFFWTDLIAGFILIFIASTFIRSVSLYLDKKYPWNKNFFPRIIYQFLAGVLLPSLFVLAYVYIYFFVIMKATKEEVVFFNAEYPIAVLLVIFWNLVYVGYFFSLESKKEKKEL